MKIYKFIVGFDIDGVLANFEGEFCDRFGFENRNLVSLSARYPNIDKELIDEFAQDPFVYAELQPIFGGVLFLRECKARGFDICLITSRPEHLWETTVNWLEMNIIEYDNLIFNKNKAEYIKSISNGGLDGGFVYLVDDIVDNLAGLPEGVTGLVWDQPWNPNYVPRVKYDQENMKIMIKDTPGDIWTPFWKNNE